MSSKGARMSDSYRQAAEAAVAASASKATYTGSATTMFGWLMSNEFIAVGGFALAVLGFIVNLYFKIKDDRRLQKAHDAQMQDINSRKSFLADAVSKEVDARLSRGDDVHEGYSGMPRPNPRKPAPAPTDEPVGQEKK